MRRVTAAPRSWRVGSIESRPDLGSRSFSILLQVADSCLFLKQKTYSEFVVRKHAKTAQATRRFCFRDNIWCFVTEEKRHEYQGCERVKTAQPTRQFQKRSHFDETHTACISGNSKILLFSKNLTRHYDFNRPWHAHTPLRGRRGRPGVGFLEAQRRPQSKNTKQGECVSLRISRFP